jgi:hypothetical protein
MEPLKAAGSPPTSRGIHRALLRVAQAVDRAHQARTDSPQGLCPTCEALQALDLAYPKWRLAL